MNLPSGKEQRNIGAVPYWGLGFQSDDANRLAWVNYQSPKSFLFANIAGQDVNDRREWLDKNNKLIIKNYVNDNTEAIRAQYQDVLESISEKNISRKELIHLMNQSAPLLQGLLASAQWAKGVIMPSEHEYAGLGIVHPFSNTGSKYKFDKNQMQHALTNFVDSTYKNNAGLFSNFKLRNGLIIPFEQKDEAEYLISRTKREESRKGLDPIDYESPFNPDNTLRPNQGHVKKTPGLDDYDSRRQRFENDELVPHQGTFGLYYSD